MAIKIFRDGRTGNQSLGYRIHLSHTEDIVMQNYGVSHL